MTVLRTLAKMISQSPIWSIGYKQYIALAMRVQWQPRIAGMSLTDHSMSGTHDRMHEITGAQL